MKTILIHQDVKGSMEFLSILSNSLPEYLVTTSLDETNPSDVEVLIFWLNVPEYLSKLNNCKLILSCGSGIDHFIHLLDIPKNVCLVRLVDPYLRKRVSNYVLARILEKYYPSFNGVDLELYKERISNLMHDKPIRVGIMGLGLIGESISNLLIEYGFKVSSWVNKKKIRSISHIYVGKSELFEFVKKSDVLVCQLPLTEETKGILNINLFNHMPKGSYLINTGRGEHLVEYDLITAIESGNLSGACLDVLKEYKTNEINPLFNNPKIRITPHIAGYIGPNTQAPYASEVINNFFKGDFIDGVVDNHLKY
jgi:glyoxylate/hydroxypyruvate reductase A